MSAIRPIATWEQEYLRTLSRLLFKFSHQEPRPDRTQTGTASEFGLQLDVPLTPGWLPALVTKSVHLKSVIVELLWFIRGETNTAFLKEHGVTIWDEWADEYGDLGPVYGAQWRSYQGCDGVIDQLQKMIETLIHDPYSRRNIVNAWRPDLLPVVGRKPNEQPKVGKQALPPCHMLFQAYVEDLSPMQRVMAAKMDPYCEVPQVLNDPGVTHEQIDSLLGTPRQGLCLRVDQRSADWFLGVPFNVTSYALLTHLLAKAAGMTPHRLVMHFGDYHLYSNHKEQAEQQLYRLRQLDLEPSKAWNLSVPTLDLRTVLPDAPYRDAEQAVRWLEAIEPEEIVTMNYQNMGKISAPVSV